jgi:hypothetical protein
MYLTLLSEYGKKDEATLSNLYKEWVNFSKSFIIETDKDFKTINTLKKKPKYFNNKDCLRCEYVFHNETSLLAFMSVDYRNSTQYIQDIDDLVINPDVDWSYVVKEIINLFKQQEYNVLSIDVTLLDHHNIIHEIFEKLNGQLITNEGHCRAIYRNTSQTRYIVPLISYENYKFKYTVRIRINPYNMHISDANIYQFTYVDEDDECASNSKYDNILILFKNPFIIERKETVTEINSETYFDLSINNLVYKECECKTPHTTDNEYCDTAFSYRRLNKLNKLSYIGYNSEYEYSYYIVFGIYFPKNIIENCSKHKGQCYTLSNGQHKNIHWVPYNISNWISDNFEIQKIKKHGIPKPMKINLPKLPEYKPSIITTCDISSLFSDKNNIIVEETNKVNKVGYIYLIQERENYELNRNIAKFGMSIQTPDNYISRVRNGYKKGSKILFIRYCEGCKTKNIENKIKEQFKRMFDPHPDGHEHFIGDFNMMIKTINNIMDYM